MRFDRRSKRDSLGAAMRGFTVGRPGQDGEYGQRAHEIQFLSVTLLSCCVSKGTIQSVRHRRGSKGEMMSCTVLYTSADVYAAIQMLFATAKGRRVVVAAFVGSDALAFLPKPKGIEVYCWPKPGSTSATGIKDLQKKGALVSFADRVHSKVYWAEGRGAVVASANLSKSALGATSLVETGVLIPAEAFDINKLLAQMTPRPVTDEGLKKLKKANPRAHFANLEKKVRTFADWLRNRSGRWKWSYYDEIQEDAECRAAVAWAREMYGVKESAKTQFCRTRGISIKDWLLIVRRSGDSGVLSPEWMYVNQIVKVTPAEKHLYDRRWPRQAVQAQPLSMCPQPPFAIDKRFTRALKLTAKEWGQKHRLETQIDEKRPTDAFLAALERNWIANPL